MEAPMAGAMGVPSMRSGKVASFKVMDVLTRALELEQQGRSIMHLEVGQPQTGAPKMVVQAAAHALKTDRIGYTPSMGIVPLRERIAEHYKEKYGVTVPMQRIVVTTGSSGAFLLAFMAAFNEGDRVAVASSSYPCYRNILNSLGCTVVTIPTNDEYKVTAREVQACLEESEAKGQLPIKGVILSSPSNPTGAMLTPGELRGLTAVCDEKGVTFISDEIYHGIAFGSKDQTALAYSGECFAINSFSKYYSMTGWRLGWMVVPTHIVDAVHRLAQNMHISAPTLSQLAAVKAFDCRDELEQHRLKYLRNREVVLKGLEEMGITDVAPSDGAFYIYVDVSDWVEDATVFARAMLEEVGVAVTPGIDFEDPSSGLGTRRLRFSFCGATEDMVEAMARMKGFWSSYPKIVKH